jgi:transposase-like protein
LDLARSVRKRCNVTGRPSPYSEEFHTDAVRLVVGSTPPRPINEVGVELGLNRETLRSWVRRSEKEAARVAAGGLSAGRFSRAASGGALRARVALGTPRRSRLDYSALALGYALRRTKAASSAEAV